MPQERRDRGAHERSKACPRSSLGGSCRFAMMAVLSSRGMLHFVFPTDPLNSRRVDEHFGDQREALARAGYSTSLVPEGVFEKGETLHGLSLASLVVYRGWMVDARQYQNFASAVQNGGASPLTRLEDYLLAHHLPNWYPLIADLTPETVVFSADVDLEHELRRLGWTAFFLKDYVKSLKTSQGSLITAPSEASRVIEDMRRFRGVIEGGICVRRVERFREGTERRYFVVRGRPFAARNGEIPGIVIEAAGRVAVPFFSIDVVLTDEDRWRIVEIGDGQVSDLVEWPVEDFVRIWGMTAS